MHIISRNSPCYYLTSVAKDRRPTFRSDEDDCWSSEMLQGTECLKMSLC